MSWSKNKLAKFSCCRYDLIQSASAFDYRAAIFLTYLGILEGRRPMNDPCVWGLLGSVRFRIWSRHWLVSVSGQFFLPFPPCPLCVLCAIFHCFFRFFYLTGGPCSKHPQLCVRKSFFLSPALLPVVPSSKGSAALHSISIVCRSGSGRFLQ